MININCNGNKGILDTCKPLQEYSWLIQEIRTNTTTMPIDEAVDAAIASMPKEYILYSFLEAHRTEVKTMLLTEYNEAETMELFKEEGRAEGILKSIHALMDSMKWTAQQAMDALGIPLTEQAQYLLKL